MTLSKRELAKREEFDEVYRQGALPAMRAIESKVCGCDYGATSWATRDEADLIAGMLGLHAGVRMLEIGAGSGWPALYLAARTGCCLVMTDLPLDGLCIATRRAFDDGISGNCAAAVADATRLPFGRCAFDAINHSDVLCCLLQKRAMLVECRRIIRPGGLMAFSVIFVPPGLTAEDHSLAVKAAPEFVETETDYPTLLEATGWAILDHRDLTAVFAQSCAAKLRLETEEHGALVRLIGAAEFDRRGEMITRRVAALERGILRRELFLARAASAAA